MEHNNIDTSARYTVKVNGMGECRLKINGHRVAPSRYGKGYGEIKEFPVPQALVQQGKLVLTGMISMKIFSIGENNQG
jgi:hypothetical protein